jgi:tripartite-type tricarboxylate transporter receptor subunit TctC
MNRCIIRGLLPAVVLKLSLQADLAWAQNKPAPLLKDYPSRPMRMLVSSAAGGANDITARAVSAKLGERVGQSVLVDNRAGGNGVIAMETLMHASPDGYTLLHSGNLVILNGVTKKVDYDVRKAFDVAVQTTSQSYLLAIVPTLNIATMKDLIAYAKAHPGELNYGSSGIGGVNHLGFEQLQLATGIKLTHVPYKGNGQAFTDLMSGRLQMIFSLGTSVAPFIRSGKLKAIGFAGTARSPAFPDVPVIADTVPGFELGNSYYLYVPAGTPMPIQVALNRGVNQVVNLPDVKEKFAADGAEPGPPTTPADLKKAFVKEYAMWDALIKKTGIKLSD